MGFEQMCKSCGGNGCSTCHGLGYKHTLDEEGLISGDFMNKLEALVREREAVNKNIDELNEQLKNATK